VEKVEYRLLVPTRPGCNSLKRQNLAEAPASGIVIPKGSFYMAILIPFRSRRLPNMAVGAKAGEEVPFSGPPAAPAIGLGLQTPGSGNPARNHALVKYGLLAHPWRDLQGFHRTSRAVRTQTRIPQPDSR